MSVADEIVRTVQEAQSGLAAKTRAEEASKQERAAWHELARWIVIAFVVLMIVLVLVVVIASLDCDMCTERARTSMGNCTLDAEDAASIDACTRQFEASAAACEATP